jgi:hypothetical protein
MPSSCRPWFRFLSLRRHRNRPRLSHPRRRSPPSSTLPRYPPRRRFTFRPAASRNRLTPPKAISRTITLWSAASEDFLTRTGISIERRAGSLLVRDPGSSRSARGPGCGVSHILGQQGTVGSSKGRRSTGQAKRRVLEPVKPLRNWPSGRNVAEQATPRDRNLTHYADRIGGGQGGDAEPHEVKQ